MIGDEPGSRPDPVSHGSTILGEIVAVVQCSSQDQSFRRMKNGHRVRNTDEKNQQRGTDPNPAPFPTTDFVQ